MKIKLEHPLLDIDGTPIPTLTLKRVVMAAVFANDQEAPEDKLRAYDIGLAIRNSNGVVDLTIEQVAYLKAKCGRLTSPLEFGQVVAAIEGGE